MGASPTKGAAWGLQQALCLGERLSAWQGARDPSEGSTGWVAQRHPREEQGCWVQAVGQPPAPRGVWKKEKALGELSPLQPWED